MTNGDKIRQMTTEEMSKKLEERKWQKMTNDITQEEINNAIDNCHFRHDVGDVRICAGDVIPCFKHIEDGKCSMLRELFKRRNKDEVELS